MLAPAGAAAGLSSPRTSACAVPGWRSWKPPQNGADVPHGASPAFAAFASFGFLGLLPLSPRTHAYVPGKTSPQRQAPGPGDGQIESHADSLRASLEGNCQPNEEVPSWEGNLSPKG